MSKNYKRKIEWFNKKGCDLEDFVKYLFIARNSSPEIGCCRDNPFLSLLIQIRDSLKLTWGISPNAPKR